MDILKISLVIVAIAITDCTHGPTTTVRTIVQNIFNYNHGSPKTSNKISWNLSKTLQTRSKTTPNQSQANGQFNSSQQKQFDNKQPQPATKSYPQQNTGGNKQYYNQGNNYKNPQQYNQNQNYNNQYQAYNTKSGNSYQTPNPQYNYQSQNPYNYQTGQNQGYNSQQSYNQNQNYAYNQQYDKYQGNYYNYDTTTKRNSYNYDTTTQYYQNYNTNRDWIQIRTSPPNYYGGNPTAPSTGYAWDTTRREYGRERWVQVGTLKQSWTTEVTPSVQQVKKTATQAPPAQRTVKTATTAPATAEKAVRTNAPTTRNLKTEVKTQAPMPIPELPPITTQIMPPAPEQQSQNVGAAQNAGLQPPASVKQAQTVGTAGSGGFQPPAAVKQPQDTSVGVTSQTSIKQSQHVKPADNIYNATHPPVVRQGPVTTTPAYDVINTSSYTVDKTPQYAESSAPSYIARTTQNNGVWTTQPPTAPTAPYFDMTNKKWTTVPPYVYSTTLAPIVTTSFWDSMFNFVPTTPFPGRKPGGCPAAFMVTFDCPARCSRDSDCYGRRKCCHDGSGYGCCSKTNARVMRMMMPLMLGGEISGFMHRGRYYGEGGQGGQAEAAGMK